MRIVAGLSRRPQVLDALLAAVIAVFTLLESTQPDRQYQHPLVMVPAALLVTLPLALRRSHPLGVLLFAMTVSVLSSLVVTTPASAGMFVALLVATYTVFVRCSRAVALRTAPVIVGGAVVTIVRDPATHGVVEALPTFGILAAVVMVAEVVRRSRQRAERLRELTVELAESRAAAEQLAAAAERLRIAREMHDVLAHGVSVMTLQVGAARMALHDAAPDVRELLSGVENLGREALVELRDILGLLRDTGSDAADDSTTPPADLDRLLASMRSAGLPLAVDGADRLDGLAPPLTLAVFRVVQEALTNTLKHAGTPATVVRFDRDDATLVVEVSDSGVPRPRPQVPGGGHGLAGLRERVAALGGRLDSGPRPGAGGWSVRAELPLAATVLVPSVAAGA